MAATFPIPQRIWGHGLVLGLPVQPTVAKVVLPNEGWNLMLPDVVCVGTGAGIARAGVVLSRMVPAKVQMCLLPVTGEGSLDV